MVDKLKDEDDDEKLVAIEDDDGTGGTVEKLEDEDPKGKKKAAPKEEEQEDTKDERLADDEGEEDDKADDTEAQRAARRQERAERKERQRRARERDTREMIFLRNRNEALERRFSGIETDLRTNRVMSLDDRIAQTEQQMRVADDVIANAIQNQNGTETVEAQNIKGQLAQNLQRLKYHREQLSKMPERQGRPQEREQQRGPDPRIKQLADAWVAKNSWYDRSRADEDSAIVGAIDDHLVSEGFDPTEADYWAELDKRVAKRLPHRAGKKPETNSDGGEQKQEQRKEAARVGPQIASGGRERQLRPGEVYVSPARRKAMEELGVWDDAVLRKKYLKRYADYDREAAAANR